MQVPHGLSGWRSPKCDLLFGVDSTGKVRAWSPRDGSRVELPPLGVDGHFVGVALSPNGDLVATQSHSAGLQLWALQSGTLRTVTMEWMAWVGYRIGFSPSGELVYAC